MMQRSNITIVNNTNQNISIIHDYLIDYAKTGIIHDDICDLFDLLRIQHEDGSIKVILDFKE